MREKERRKKEGRSIRKNNINNDKSNQFIYKNRKHFYISPLRQSPLLYHCLHHPLVVVAIILQQRSNADPASFFSNLESTLSMIARYLAFSFLPVKSFSVTAIINRDFDTFSAFFLIQTLYLEVFNNIFNNNNTNI